MTLSHLLSTYLRQGTGYGGKQSRITDSFLVAMPTCSKHTHFQANGDNSDMPKCLWFKTSHSLHACIGSLPVCHRCDPASYIIYMYVISLIRYKLSSDYCLPEQKVVDTWAGKQLLYI